MRRLIRKYNFSGGVNNREAPYLLADNEMADCENITLKEAGKAKTRKGTSAYKTLPSIAGETVVDECDSASGWSGGSRVSPSLDTGTYYEPTGSIKGTRDGYGEEVDDCDSGTYWSGHTSIDSSNQYEGSGCLKKTVTLGEVLDTCDSASGWTNATLDTSIKYQGTGSLKIAPGTLAYKSISKNYGDYDQTARLSFYARTDNPPRTYIIRFYSGGSGTDYYYAYFSVYTGWTLITLYKSSFASVGSPSWANITKIEVENGSISSYLWIDYITWQEKKRADIYNTSTTCTWTPSSAKNYSGYDSTAKLCVYFKHAMNPTALKSLALTVMAWSGANHSHLTRSLTPANNANIWKLETFVKGSFSGSADWSSINKLYFHLSFEYNSYLSPGTSITWYLDQVSWRESSFTCTLQRSFSPAKDFSSIPTDGLLNVYLRYHEIPYQAAASLTVKLYSGSAYFYRQVSVDMAKGDSWQKLSARKGDFSKSGSPSWASIDKLAIDVAYTLSEYVYSEEDLFFHIDYISWQAPSDSNKITGLWEFRNQAGTTTKEIACLGTKIYDLSGPTEKQKTGGMTSGYDYAFVNAFNKVFAANGADDVQYWNGGSGNFADVGNPANTWPQSSPNDTTPPKCKYLAVHRERLWCFGLTRSGYESYLVWGAVGDPTAGAGQWPATNYIVIGPNQGDQPTGLCVLRDALVLFKQYSIWMLFGSNEDDFTLVEIEHERRHGCIAPKSLCLADEGVYYLSQDGVRVFNGERSVLISDKVRNTFVDEVDVSLLKNAVAVYHDGTYRLWLVEDGGSSDNAYPDMALVYDPHLAAWTRWRASANGFYPNQFALFGGKLYGGGCLEPMVAKCDDGYSDLGNAIKTSIKTGQLNCGVPEIHKFFHHLYVGADAVSDDYTLTVLAETEKPSETVSYEFSLRGDDNLIENRQTIALRGRYLQLTFSHEGANQPVGVEGFTLAYKHAKVK